MYSTILRFCASFGPVGRDVIESTYGFTCQWRCLDVTVFSSQRGVSSMGKREIPLDLRRIHQQKSLHDNVYFYDFEKFSYLKGIFLGF